MKIISFAVCPVASQVGHDADEARANLLEDGSIFCVTCNQTHPATAESARRAEEAKRPRIVATAVCPVASQVGHDADEARANLLSDGRILCISCGTAHPATVESARRAQDAASRYTR